MSTIFGHGDLRLYLLSLLAEQPRHGYELIQELSDRFGGAYSPSAGTIYPRLAKLEDEGLVTKSTDGRKTVYAITDAGRAELDARQDDLDSIENNVSDSLRTLADGLRAGVNDAMRSLRADLAAAARASRPEPGRTYTDGRTSADGRARTPVAEPNYGFPPTAGTATSGEAAVADASGASDASGAFDATGAGGSGGNGSEPNYGHAAPTAAEEQRRLNNDAVRDIEAALNSFRSAVRVDVRKHAARASVSPAAVAHFTAELKRLQAELKATLGG